MSSRAWTRLRVDGRIPGLGEHQRALLQVEVLSVPEAEGKKVVIGGLAVKVQNDLLRPAAEGRVIAHRVRAEPLGGAGAAGNNLLADRAVNGRVLIREQVKQSESLALGEPFRQCYGASAIHSLKLRW